MREFKIRVFVEDEQKMYQCEEIALVSPNTPFLKTTKGKIGMVALKFNGAVSHQFTGNIYEMTFTELEDSKGNEIYEGDIVLNKNGVKGHILYNHGCYRVKYVNGLEYFLYDEVHHLVIVGNIYEDLEMAKGLDL